jgi:protein-S-isoprenylcysteine O-methyltransferase Ste14
MKGCAMADSNDIELADHLTRRRARVSTVLAVMFMASMAQSFGVETAPNRPQTLHLAAWIVWAMMLVLLLALGGGYGRSRTIRGLMNDETTRVNRREAMAAGFWAAVFSGFGLYALNLFVPLTAAEAIRLSLTATVATGLLWFGKRERESLRDD